MGGAGGTSAGGAISSTGAGGASSFFLQLTDTTKVDAKNKQSMSIRNFRISGYLLCISG